MLGLESPSSVLCLFTTTDFDLYTTKYVNFTLNILSF